MRLRDLIGTPCNKQVPKVAAPERVVGCVTSRRYGTQLLAARTSFFDFTSLITYHRRHRDVCATARGSP